MNRYKEILLVEDDRLFQFITQAMIEKKGISERVICKSNGAEALAFLKDSSLISNELMIDHWPDLILLDINMPVMNGFEFLQALQDMGAQTLIHSKVVVLSSSNDASDREVASSFGVRGYILKPFTIEKLQVVL